MKYLVKVKTNRLKEEVIGPVKGALSVSVKPFPEKGKADKVLIGLLATHFKTQQSQIR